MIILLIESSKETVSVVDNSGSKGEFLKAQRGKSAAISWEIITWTKVHMWVWLYSASLLTFLKLEKE